MSAENVLLLYLDSSGPSTASPPSVDAVCSTGQTHKTLFYVMRAVLENRGDMRLGWQPTPTMTAVLVRLLGKPFPRTHFAVACPRSAVVADFTLLRLRAFNV